MLEITASYPAGPVGTTAQNLQGSRRRRSMRNGPTCILRSPRQPRKKASMIAANFKLVAQVEQGHEEALSASARPFGHTDTMFGDAEEVLWQCRYCGYIHRGKNAPKKCPVWEKSPQGYFERKSRQFLKTTTVALAHAKRY